MTFLNNTISYKSTVSNLPSTSTTTVESTAVSPVISPTPSDSSQKSKNQKVEEAIIEALNKINDYESCLNSEPKQPVNPNCLRISELLNQMPERARTALKIKLLGMAFEETKNF